MSKSKSEKLCRAGSAAASLYTRGPCKVRHNARRSSRHHVAKLTLQWEGLPDHHEGYPAKLHHMCNSIEGKTQRAVVQSKQSLPLGLQSSTP